MTVVLVALLAILSTVQAACADTYQDTASFEISGSGPRAARRCKVVLKPTQATGGENAPRLVLLPRSDAPITVGLDRPDAYGDAVIVQGNQRKPFATLGQVSAEEFRPSLIGQALRSQKLFFVTAKVRSSGRFVSSRYEIADFDAVLSAMATHCPFDAEPLLDDISQAARAEVSLNLSMPALTAIRWALRARYGDTTKPEPRTTLAAAERVLLKRYTRETDLPQTQYLSPDNSRRLLEAGDRLQREEAERAARFAEADGAREAERRELDDRRLNRARVTFIGNNKSPFAIVMQLQTSSYKYFWPNKNKFWTVNPGQTFREDIVCREGEQICFGAHAEGDRSITWGVSLYDNTSCEKCCFNCTNTFTKDVDFVHRGATAGVAPWTGAVCNAGSEATSIRTGPSAKNFPVIAKLPNGYRVRVLTQERNGDGFTWSRIEFAGEGRRMEGWVYAEFVKASC